MTAQGVHASLQENFRSTWRNWKGGLLTRYGHRCSPNARSSFYGHFFDARRSSPSSLSLFLSFSHPRVYPAPTIVITFAILHLRGFPIAAHPLLRAAPQYIFFSRRDARARIHRPFADFVCNVSHLCNAVRIFSRMHYARWKLLFAFNGSQTNRAYFLRASYRVPR